MNIFLKYSGTVCAILVLSTTCGCLRSNTPTGVSDNVNVSISGDGVTVEGTADAGAEAASGSYAGGIGAEAAESSVSGVYETAATGYASKRTLKNLLSTALKPLGTTMYIWGGGWNKEDTGAGIECLSLGLSDEWRIFAGKQTADYDFKDYEYEIHEGLDCSGYIGWLIYNVLEDEDYTGDEDGYVSAGYVTSSTLMSDMLSGKGLGAVDDTAQDTIYHPGDIVSMQGHVWMSLGMCEDGSVLLIHSSPPGVKISGTLLDDGTESLAVRLAEDIMSTYYPDWYERYPDASVSGSYLKNARILHWNTETLGDEEGITGMDAEEIKKYLFRE